MKIYEEDVQRNVSRAEVMYLTKVYACPFSIKSVIFQKSKLGLTKQNIFFITNENQAILNTFYIFYSLNR